MDQSPHNLNPKQEQLSFLILCLLYLLCGWVMFHYLKYQQNPDGISYLTIAKSYASGNWGDAINAYWSPLLSWLLAIFAWMPVELLFVFKFLNLLSGLMALIAVRSVFGKYGLTPGWSMLLLTLLAVLLLRIVFEVTTPDLISATLLLWFFRHWLSGKALLQPTCTALWMTVLYWAKAYNLYFVAGILAFDAIIWSVAGIYSPAKLWKGFLLITGLFFLFCFPWLLAIYIKYDQFMLTGSGAFNHGGTMYDNWKYLLEFVAPPNQRSVFAWEDPFLLSGFRDYDVFGSWNNFQFQLNVVWKNLQVILFQASSTNVILLGGTLLLLIGIYLYGRKMKVKSAWLCLPAENEFFRFFVFFCLYASGYLLMLMENRYFWGNVLLAVTLVGIFTARFVQSPVNKIPGNLPLPLFFLLLLLMSGAFFRYLNHANFFSANGLAANKRSVLEYRLGKQLELLPEDKKRMAKWPSRGDYTMFGSWNVAYFAGGRHYFSLPEDIEKAGKLITDSSISLVFVPSDITVPKNFIISNWTKNSAVMEGTDLYERP